MHSFACYDLTPFIIFSVHHSIVCVFRMYSFLLLLSKLEMSMRNEVVNVNSTENDNTLVECCYLDASKLFVIEIEMYFNCHSLLLLGYSSWTDSDENSYRFYISSHGKQKHPQGDSWVPRSRRAL